MELEAVRVENYKKIQDTGWVPVEKLTALVGKNEAGKTALLRGLSKLKPTDGEKYNGVKEFPHGRYTKEFKQQDWPVASARYGLTAEERKELVGICLLLSKVKSVTVTRHYSGELTVLYTPDLKMPSVTAKEWTERLTAVNAMLDNAVVPEDKAEQWPPARQVLITAVANHLRQAQSSPPQLLQVTALRDQVAKAMAEEWAAKLLQPALDAVDEVKGTLAIIESLPKAKAWVAEHIPYFLYFGKYEVLESKIFIPEFLRRISEKTSRTRVQLAMFKHVGVDIQDLANLGRHKPDQTDEEPSVRQQIDELTIKANSASIAMTRQFGEWWLQRHHQFSYDFNGNYFRIWVCDDLDPAKVELEERSEGMRYFFSFYLLFLVEAEDLHRKCVLLLDEPGLHLHGTAQGTLVKFLEKLSGQNQVIYTTHSPFMVDGAHMERIRAVYETSGGTKVSSDVWPKDRDTLFPLQAALGYSVCQSLFLSRKQVLVEGPTDYMLLHALNNQLACRKEPHLDDDIVMLPVNGAKNMAPLASLLAGHDIQIVIFMDSDRAARISQQKLQHIMADLNKQCLQAHQFSDDPDVKELEDLIPAEYYLKAAGRAYPKVVFDFNAEEKQIANVVDRIEHLFERMKLPKFDKRLPIHVIVQDMNMDSEAVPVELYEMGKKVLTTINVAFVTAGAKAAG